MLFSVAWLNDAPEYLAAVVAKASAWWSSKMAKFARVVDGVAVEVFIPPEGVKIEDCFHESIVKQFVECPNEVTANSTVSAKGKWTINVPEEVEKA